MTRRTRITPAVLRNQSDSFLCERAAEDQQIILSAITPPLARERSNRSLKFILAEIKRHGTVCLWPRFDLAPVDYSPQDRAPEFIRRKLEREIRELREQALKLTETYMQQRTFIHNQIKEKEALL